MFAVDSFLFFQDSKHEYIAIKFILQNYACLSGQTNNFKKSGIFFSLNVDVHLQHDITIELGVSLPLDIDGYLGLPSLIGI